VGVYLREKDLDDLVKSNELIGTPIRVEHGSCNVGTVISVYKNGSNLDAILKIDNNSIESMLASSFVQLGKCQELSLGYVVEMELSANGQLNGGRKRVNEISLVKKGICHIFQFVHFVFIDNFVEQGPDTIAKSTAGEDDISCLQMGIVCSFFIVC
jgi:hypothetical protein